VPDIFASQVLFQVISCGQINSLADEKTFALPFSLHFCCHKK